MLIKRQRFHRLVLPCGLIVLAMWGIACGREGTSTRQPAAASDQVASGPCSTNGMEFAKVYGSVESIAGAFSTTTAGVTSVRQDRFGPDGPKPLTGFAGHSSDEKVWLCYYDGQFEVHKGVLPGSTAVPAEYGRLSVIVFADGSVTFDAAGPQDKIPAEGP